VAVYEFRTAEDIEELLNQVQLSGAQRRHSGSGDLRRSCYFRSEGVLLTLRLWAPDDEQFASAVAPLRRVLGPPTSLDA
jgi:hypothetical protein